MGQHGFVLGHMVVREVDLNGRIPRLCVLGETEVSRFALVMLTKWFSLPRLETRTKEFNTCASTGVANPRAQ